MPAVDPVQPIRLEERTARPVRLDRGADRLEPVEDLAPERANALRVGRREPQLGTARERLPNPHPGRDAERLGRRGDLADHLLAPRLGRERDRLGEHRPPVPDRGKKLEAGIEDADDHTNICSHTMNGRRGRHFSAPG